MSKTNETTNPFDNIKQEKAQDKVQVIETEGTQEGDFETYSPKEKNLIKFSTDKAQRGSMTVRIFGTASKVEGNVRLNKLHSHSFSNPNGDGTDAKVLPSRTLRYPLASNKMEKMRADVANQVVQSMDWNTFNSYKSLGTDPLMNNLSNALWNLARIDMGIDDARNQKELISTSKFAKEQLFFKKGFSNKLYSSSPYAIYNLMVLDGSEENKDAIGQVGQLRASAMLMDAIETLENGIEGYSYEYRNVTQEQDKVYGLADFGHSLIFQKSFDIVISSQIDKENVKSRAYTVMFADDEVDQMFVDISRKQEDAKRKNKEFIMTDAMRKEYTELLDSKATLPSNKDWSNYMTWEDFGGTLSDDELKKQNTEYLKVIAEFIATWKPRYISEDEWVKVIDDKVLPNGKKFNQIAQFEGVNLLQIRKEFLENIADTPSEGTKEQTAVEPKNNTATPSKETTQKEAVKTEDLKETKSEDTAEDIWAVVADDLD